MRVSKIRYRKNAMTDKYISEHVEMEAELLVGEDHELALELLKDMVHRALARKTERAKSRPKDTSRFNVLDIE